MRQIIIATIFLSFLWSCNSSTKKEKSTESEKATEQTDSDFESYISTKKEKSTESEKATEQTDSDFESYISTLDQITLPLETNPLGQLPIISKNYDKNKFEKYKHTWTSQPLGIYYQDEKTVGIIDCSIGDWGLVPFLTTYDLKGNKIDSTGFYDKSGQDMGYEAIEHVTFNTDRRITVLDTVKRWDFNEDKTEIIEGSMKMTTEKVEFRILENGRIEKK